MMNQPLIRIGSSAFDAASVGAAILVAIIALALVAWVLAMSLIADAASAKGHDCEVRLWLVGLLLTPLTAAIIVCAMPDMRPRERDVALPAQVPPEPASDDGWPFGEGPRP